MLDLESLGITKKELQDRVVDRIVYDLRYDNHIDDEGRERKTYSGFEDKIKEDVLKRADEVIQKLGEKYVLPNIMEYLEKFSFQKTNEYGQKKGEPITFVEYIVKQADAYLKEDVDRDGKSAEQNKTYGFHAHSTRLVYIIDKYLQDSIQKAMVQAVGLADKTFAESLSRSVELALQNIKVTVNTKLTTKE